MDNDIQEYLDCSDNMRHYGNHQAVLITAFVTLNGAIAALVFGTGTLSDFFQDFGAKLLALGISILFAIMIQSALTMWDHFFERAAVLEEELNLEQYTTLPGYSKPPATPEGSSSFKRLPIRPAKWAIQSLVVFTIIFWLLALINQW